MKLAARLLALFAAEWVLECVMCAPVVGPHMAMMDTFNSDVASGVATHTSVNGSIDGSVNRLSGVWNLPSWNDTNSLNVAQVNDMSNRAMMVASPQQFSAGIRIEIQLVRFEDPGSLMYDGQYCDTTSKCDPRFFVDLDVNTAYAAWPGPRPVNTFQHIIDRTNQDVFDLGEGVSKDICGNVSAANLRVEVVDMEDVSEPDLMNDFDCVFRLGVVGATQDTPWSAIQQCRAYYNVDTVKLYFRHREYALPSDAALQTC